MFFLLSISAHFGILSIHLSCSIFSPVSHGFYIFLFSYPLSVVDQLITGSLPAIIDPYNS